MRAALRTFASRKISRGSRACLVAVPAVSLAFASTSRCDEQHGLEATPHNVMKAWLACGTPKGDVLIRPDWFDSRSPCQKRIIEQREEWISVYRDAVQGRLDNAWLSPSDPESHLALVLVLDQFSRIICKDKEKYAGHARALEIARSAVANGLDSQVAPELRMWFYFPFLHSENEQDQVQSRALFSALAEEDPRMRPMMASVNAHHDAVKRFGRLPERNSTLQRKSTFEEIKFLRSCPTS